MKSDNKVDEVRLAYDNLEHVFLKFSNGNMHESNKHPLGDPDRVEIYFDETQKEHLALLRSKLMFEMSEKINRTLEKSSSSSDGLGRKLFWLNVVMAIFTFMLAVSAIIELTQ